MNDPLRAFMQANALSAPAFAPDSRYYGLATKQWTRADGVEISYVQRRLVPPPENFATLQEHRIEVGDRVDNLAAKYLADPLQYWRLCDGNGAVRPNELTEVIGTTIRITLPEGVPSGTQV
jgi:hypothetical protein